MTKLRSYYSTCRLVFISYAMGYLNLNILMPRVLVNAFFKMSSISAFKIHYCIQQYHQISSCHVLSDPIILLIYFLPRNFFCAASLFHVCTFLSLFQMIFQYSFCHSDRLADLISNHQYRWQCFLLESCCLCVWFSL